MAGLSPTRLWNGCWRANHDRTCWPFRSTYGCSQSSPEPCRSRNAAQGNPIFEPHARQYRPLQALSASAHTVAALLDDLPDDLEEPLVEVLRPVAERKAYNIVHLIYRARNYEGHSKDYEFSRPTMRIIGALGITTPFELSVILTSSNAPLISRAWRFLISNMTAVSSQCAIPNTERNRNMHERTSANERSQCR